MKFPWSKKQEQEQQQPEHKITRPKEDYIQVGLAFMAAILIWFFFPVLATLPFGFALLVGFGMRQTPTNLGNWLEGCVYLIGIFGSWYLWYQEIYAGWPVWSTQALITSCSVLVFLLNFGQVIAKAVAWLDRKPRFTVPNQGGGE